MCEEWNLDIVNGSLIFLSLSRDRIYHSLIIGIQDILFPSHLTVIDLSLYRSNGREIFLDCVTCGKAKVHATFHILHDLRCKANICEVIACITSNRQRVAVLAYLRMDEQWETQSYKQKFIG